MRIPNWDSEHLFCEYALVDFDVDAGSAAYDLSSAYTKPLRAIKVRAAAFHSVLMYSALIFFNIPVLLCQKEYHNSQSTTNDFSYQRKYGNRIAGRAIDDGEQNNNTFFFFFISLVDVAVVVSSSIALVRGDLFWFLCSLLSPSAFLISLSISVFFGHSTRLKMMCSLV